MKSFIFILFSFMATMLAAEQTSSDKSAISVDPKDPHYDTKPWIDGMKTFHGGKIDHFSGDYEVITSPIIDASTGRRTEIGRLAQLNHNDVQEVLNSAKTAWNNGQGVWPQMTANQRIEALEKVVISLKQKRDQIVNVLMWEICKSTDDAAAEFDRTMTFIEATINAFREIDTVEGGWKTVSGILARVRRAAIGIVMCLGPFNYPFNETYATLIPALLAGNVIIMKIPNTGGLAHVLTMEAYSEHLPAGAINFFSGSGRETVGPIMSTGDIDVLAFIGGSHAADSIIKHHPHPHRLKVFLQLEGKNLGVVLADAHLDTAVEQVLLGSTSYNGQRCTAIKLVMVHSSIAQQFVEKFSAAVSQLRWGLPWAPKVQITPLPEHKKPKYLQDLIADGVAKGATVVNAHDGGGDLHGALMRPAVVFPVTKDMRLWHEEQFGPVIPVGVFTDLSELYEYIAHTPYGQQAAVFTSHADASSAELIDVLSTAVGRININTQCGRSPDALPFSGRRSSALGTMSVTEALRAFTTEVVLAGKYSASNEAVMRGFESTSKFMEPLTNNKNVKNEL
jgi:glyceraldehyde-3-phosphate dehydrogenase (NADP+)